MNVTVGVNSYVTVQYADSLLETSVRAASKWDALDTTTKQASLLTMFRLLEQQTWQGAKADFIVVQSFAIASAGTGYVAGDILSLVGGTGDACTIEVLTVDGSGVITSSVLRDGGLYSTVPTGTITTTGGTGSGATCTVTSGVQTTSWPRTGASDRYGESVGADEYPDALKQAQVQGAYELSQDPELETAKNADQNLSSMSAGSVSLAFFQPTVGAGRFPAVVQELIADLLSGPAGTGAPTITGGAECSAFEDNPFGLVGGP